MRSFEDLSKKELADFFDYYYSGGAVKKWLKEHDVDTSHTSIHEHFPPEELEERCDQCGEKLYKKRLARSNTNEDDLKASVYCPACNHRPNVDKCECEKCKQKPERLEEERRSAVKEYCENRAKQKKPFSELSFCAKVFLGVALRASSSPDLKRINPIVDALCKVVPSGGNCKWYIMDTLAREKSISPSPDAPIDAFCFEKGIPVTYYPARMLFNLNIETDWSDYSLYLNLTSPSYFSKDDKDAAIQLWREIASYECQEYLEYQLDLFDFNYVFEKRTDAIFLSLLYDYSVSQIYSIIWASVSKLLREIVDARLTLKALEESVHVETDKTELEKTQKLINNSKKDLEEMEKNAQNKVLLWCQSYSNLPDCEKKKIGLFNRIEALPQSEISAFFFNQVIKIGDKGFYRVPNYTDLNAG